MEEPLYSLPVRSIFTAFDLLKRDVEVALRTQIGDRARLDEQVRVCHRLLDSIQMVSHIDSQYMQT